MKKSMLLAMLLCVFVLSNQAVAGDWKKLGEKTVNLLGERESIWVSDHNRYNFIKLKVLDQGVEFRKVVVVFGDGQRREMPVRSFIRKGGETVALQLPRGSRYITRIILEYKTRSGTLKRGRVVVYGRRS